jgi:hypothetical protein
VDARIDQVARDVFGFPGLRPGQREAIESVLAGRDTLVVMSTRAGKSAIYQIAGLLSEGAGVVQRYDDDAVVVLFDEVGYTTPALDVVRERGLLESA